MIDFYYWPTANGHKISIMLEETGLAHRIIPIDIERGEQHEAPFGAINPNRKMPAIVDHAPTDGGPPIRVFESGAILLYLAEKSGQLLPGDARGRSEVVQWVAWQIAGVGPMAGQAHHFMAFAPEKIPYAIKRFSEEVHRLCRVLDTQLADRAYIAGAYSIADIACWPWFRGIATRLPRFDIEFPHLKRWLETVGARPAAQRAIANREVG